MTIAERVVAEVDRATDEIVEYTVDLVRLPTVNPPGEAYEACARFIGDDLRAPRVRGRVHRRRGRWRNTPRVIRASTSSARVAAAPGPVVHLNGHFDVVPPAMAGRVDPFGGLVRDGTHLRPRRLRHEGRHRRGALCRRSDRARRDRAAGHDRNQRHGGRGERRVRRRRVARASADGSPKGRTDFVIIPEPLNVDRICVGHRGVYWFEVTTRGRIAHGSMPFLGVSAIDGMGRVARRGARRAGAGARGAADGDAGRAAGARHATININGIEGGQPVGGIQTPCVADLLPRGVRSAVPARRRLRRGESARLKQLHRARARRHAGTCALRDARL